MNSGIIIIISLRDVRQADSSGRYAFCLPIIGQKKARDSREKNSGLIVYNMGGAFRGIFWRRPIAIRYYCSKTFFPSHVLTRISETVLAIINRRDPKQTPDF